MEKVGLGQDSDMFVNPPAAYIPVYMQGYAQATQNRLIAEARKEVEEEAAAEQQTEQSSPAASHDGQHEVIDRDVVTMEGTDNEAEENLPEQTVQIAEQTAELAEQTADVELD